MLIALLKSDYEYKKDWKSFDFLNQVSKNSKNFIFSLIFPLILIAGFCVFPKDIYAEELKPEDIINQQSINLNEKDAKKILNSLIQKIKEEWINVSASSDNFKLEDQAVLTIIRGALGPKIAGYLLFEAPQEIASSLISATLKIIRLAYSGDISAFIGEIEKLTVNEAKRYLMDWFLQNEIRINKGNLEINYPDYNNNWQKIIFPYIIVFKPLSGSQGEIGISFYSSKIIKTPYPKWKFQWEGGIEELPPFRLDIKGVIEKSEYNGIHWPQSPQIKVIFDEPVPDFDFPAPGFGEKIVNGIKSQLNIAQIIFGKIQNIATDITKGATSTVKGATKGILNLIKSFFTDFGLLKATVATDDFLKTPGLDLSKINIENLNKIGNISEDIKNKGEELAVAVEDIKAVEDIGNDNSEDINNDDSKKDDGKPLTLEEIREKLDDISEKIDMLNQEISDLIGETPSISLAPPQALVDENKNKVEDEGSEENDDANKNNQEPDGKIDQLPNPIINGRGSISYCDKTLEQEAGRDKIILNEIAWMGTADSASNEWIELKNITQEPVNLSGWQLLDKTNQIKVIFAENDIIPASGFYLLERMDNNSVPSVEANRIYTGALNDSNEELYLFNSSCNLQDKVIAAPDWPAGSKEDKKSMERSADLSWHTYSGAGENGIMATPKSENSVPLPPKIPPEIPPEVPPELPPEEPPKETPKILINEIQIDSKIGTGGVDDDWVELYNPNDSPVSLKGWSIQKHSKDEPCSVGKGFYGKHFLSDAVIPAKGFFLIIDTKAKESLKNLADMTVSWTLSNDNTIYLVKNQEDIESGDDADIIDKVGFGDASCFAEISPAINPPEAKSIERKKLGVDTNDNSNDFEARDPSPTNSKGETIQPPSFSEAPWPMFQQNSRHTGASPFAGPARNASHSDAGGPARNASHSDAGGPARNASHSDAGGPASSDSPKLSVFLEGEGDNDYFGDPAVGSDGTLYLGAKITKEGVTREGVFAFAYDGTEKWFSGPFSGLQVPALSESDGILYVPSYEGLLAINITNGNLRWKKDFAGLYSWQSPVIDSGIIYFISACKLSDESGASCLVSFQNTGAINWIYAIEKGEFCFDCTLPDDCETGSGSSPTPSIPTIDKNGTIYISYNDTLFSLNPDGTKKWERKFLPDCRIFQCNIRLQQPIIGDNGLLYIMAMAEKDFRAMQEEGTYPCLHIIDPANPEQDNSEKKCDQFFRSGGNLSISAAGNIYSSGFVNPDGSLRILLYGTDSQGNTLPDWNVVVRASEWAGSLLIDKNELIYGVFGSLVKAFNQTGQEVMSLATSWWRNLNPVLAGDGKLFIAGSKKLYVIEP